LNGNQTNALDSGSVIPVKTGTGMTDAKQFCVITYFLDIFLVPAQLQILCPVQRLCLLYDGRNRNRGYRSQLLAAMPALFR